MFVFLCLEQLPNPHPQIRASLDENSKKFQSFESLIVKKTKKKEDSKRRSSVNISAMPAPMTTSARKVKNLATKWKINLTPLLQREPLRPLNSSRLNTTYTAAAGRRPSSSLAAGPPWSSGRGLPRFHEEPARAVASLMKEAGIPSTLS